MFSFLLIVQTLIAVSLVGVILMQRSEGGGLGVGGSSSGFMTARGAADFLTRSTAVLGGMFIVLSIVMAAFAGVSHKRTGIDTSLARQAPQGQQQLPPLALPQVQPGAPANGAAPAGNGSVPLAQ